MNTARNLKRQEARDAARSAAPRLNRNGNLSGMHGNYGHRKKLPARQSALDRGDVRFVDKPCKYGHSGERYTKSNACCECVRIHSLGVKRANPEKHIASVIAWANDNPDKRKAVVKASAAKRRAIKINAMPLWLTIDQIDYMKDFWKNCPSDMWVDHIVPLLSEKVCGLHVPCNLRYLDPIENIKKGNRYWPNDWRE